MERVTSLEALDNFIHDAMQFHAEAIDWKARSLLLHDPDLQCYALAYIPDFPRPFSTRVIVMARVVGDKVVIEEDTTDKPLYEALMQVGIPREQIILVYAGESLPDSSANE